MKKEVELAKIKEKNKRVKKILDDIGANDPVFDPEMGSIEKPEMLLTTTDEEVLTAQYSYVFKIFVGRLRYLAEFKVILKNSLFNCKPCAYACSGMHVFASKK